MPEIGLFWGSFFNRCVGIPTYDSESFEPELNGIPGGTSELWLEFRPKPFSVFGDQVSAHTNILYHGEALLLWEKKTASTLPSLSRVQRPTQGRAGGVISNTTPARGAQRNMLTALALTLAFYHHPLAAVPYHRQLVVRGTPAQLRTPPPAPPQSSGLFRSFSSSGLELFRGPQTALLSAFKDTLKGLSPITFLTDCMRSLVLAAITMEALQFTLVASASYLATPLPAPQRLAAAAQIAQRSREATRGMRILVWAYLFPQKLGALLAAPAQQRRAAFFLAFVRALVPPAAVLAAMRTLDASVLASSGAAPFVGLACLLFDRDGDGRIRAEEALFVIKDGAVQIWQRTLRAWAAGGPLLEWLASIDDKILACARRVAAAVASLHLGDRAVLVARLVEAKARVALR